MVKAKTARQITASKRNLIKARLKRHKKLVIGTAVVAGVGAGVALAPAIAGEYHWHFGHGRGSSRRHFAERNAYVKSRYQKVGYAAMTPRQRGDYDAYRWARSRKRLAKIKGQTPPHGAWHRAGMQMGPSHKVRGKAQVKRNQIAGHKVRNAYV